jgi:hypothetical protein
MRLTHLVLLWSLASTALAANDAAPAGRLPEGVTPTHYHLTLHIDPRAARFSGRTVIRVTLTAPTRTGAESFLAGLGDSLCSRAGREQFDAVLAGRLRPMSGGELEVARAQETIDNCIALRQAVGGQLQAALVAAP